MVYGDNAKIVQSSIINHSSEQWVVKYKSCNSIVSFFFYYTTFIVLSDYSYTHFNQCWPIIHGVRVVGIIITSYGLQCFPYYTTMRFDFKSFWILMVNFWSLLLFVVIWTKYKLFSINCIYSSMLEFRSLDINVLIIVFYNIITIKLEQNYK